MDKISVELAKNISQIMAEFDFEITVEILKLMDIKWKRDEEERYPTLDDVRQTADYLLWHVIEYAYKYKENFAFSECGCFRAEYHYDDTTKEEWVDLIFEPCVWRRIC